MSQKEQQLMEAVGWGWIASLIIHLLLIVFLFVRLPDLTAPAAEQTVKVELVPPQPEPKPESAPAPAPTSKQKPEEAKPASGQQPQVFESASQEKQQEEPKTNDLPTESTDEAQSTQNNEADSTAKNEAGEEAKANETPAEHTASAAQESVDLDGVFPTVTNPPIPADKLLPAKADVAAQQGGQASSANQTAKKLKKAQRIYSAEALSDPHVKQALGKLPPAQRVKQVCGIEALEQIRNQQPGTVPVSLAGPRVPDSATEFNLIGGAFLSRDQWYELDIKCLVDANSAAIKSFSFHIGGAIPKSEWSKRELR